MLVEFFKIMVALLTVYGGYCLIINVTYTLLCKNKSKIHIAYFAEKNEKNYSDIFFAKKAFMGRNRAIILVDYNQDDSVLEEIAEVAPYAEVYRTERIK